MTEIIDGITYRLLVTEDDTPVGHLWAEEMAEEIEEIRERLDRGDIWAWASVECRAEITTVSGRKFSGSDYLGGCSYANEMDFCQPGGYWESMKTEAKEALIETLEDIAREGRDAQAVLNQMRAL